MNNHEIERAALLLSLVTYHHGSDTILLAPMVTDDGPVEWFEARDQLLLQIAVAGASEQIDAAPPPDQVPSFTLTADCDVAPLLLELLGRQLLHRTPDQAALGLEALHASEDMRAWQLRMRTLHAAVQEGGSAAAIDAGAMARLAQGAGGASHG